MIERDVPRSEWVPELAKRIIRRHWILGYCDRCRDRSGDCASLRWARDRLRTRRLPDDPTPTPQPPHPLTPYPPRDPAARSRRSCGCGP
ncbi:hypothetical protein [Micromonospora sp. NPDC049282]|uniref:hypothetical protein n=1 Tax=Micromonospora sp. NPDC049282 TaxID=3364269 RepID=UPI0037246F3B